MMTRVKKASDMRENMQKRIIPVKLIAAFVAAACSIAQGQNATLEQQLMSQYKLTSVTADNSTVVTQGSTLVFQKRGFYAGLSTNQVPAVNSFKDGQIKSDVAGKAKDVVDRASRIPILGSRIPGSTPMAYNGPTREFVTGEHMYVTRITVNSSRDVVTLELISDFFDGLGRYKGLLKVSVPPSGDYSRIQSVIAQVFQAIDPASTVDPNAQPASMVPQTVSAGGGYPPIAPPPAQQDTALAPIEIPPPPTDSVAPPTAVETKVVEIGQTKEQVIAILGTPDLVFNGSGTKQIFHYKKINTKITFVDGKAADAQ